MKSHEIRESFLKFFRVRGHKIVPSMSLVPTDDPSLLFTSAGMVQFKPLWSGAVSLPYRRAATCQRCLRLSDLPNVGQTRRHHTFFEMLGNFSFGDYFKEEAIGWAWEYLVNVLGIDKKRLYISVHKDDEEAYNIWHKKVGIRKARIYQLGDKQNFWGPAGNAGPCGPCSEIFFDLGKKFSCGRKTCGVGCECDRYIELWNMVFPQFNQLKSGKRLPLKNRGIDTGMGLERLALVLQNKCSNYHTDLFYPIIESITKRLNIEYNKDSARDIAVNIIADHIRALVFAIADGVMPSNEERGYVIRRLLRRAVRFARKLGADKPMLYNLVPVVVENFSPAYPDLLPRREEITLVIKSEEERFLNTLENGLTRLESMSKKKSFISSLDAFILYDTYGFPIELTQEIAKEKGIEVDTKGFFERLKSARELSRAKTKFIPKGEWRIIKQGTGTFVGYNKASVKTEVLRYNNYDINKEKFIDIVLKENPFYPEMGGQIGETGEILGNNFQAECLNTYWYQGMAVNHCRWQKKKIIPRSVQASVDMLKRKESARAHTATHLLHRALREVLGKHVRQEGSRVELGRLTFDFPHFRSLSEDEIDAVEDLVNEKILENIRVEKFYTTLEKAKRRGAVALFGEKYGERVRVVKIGDFSIELCGGIHLDNTGEIGGFKIISQEAVSAGIKRVEAIVGQRLFRTFKRDEKQLKEIASLCGTDSDIVKKIEETQRALKKLHQMNARFTRRVAAYEAESIINEKRGKGINLVAREFNGYGMETLRFIADLVRERTKELVGLLYEKNKNRVNYLIFVTPDLEKKLPASKIITDFSKYIGGGGGGRPHLAQGGGDADKLPRAIGWLRKII